MPLTGIFRRAGSITHSDNDKRSLELPRDFAIGGLMLEMAGDVVVGTADADALYAQSPYSLLDRVELTLDGKDTIVSVPGYQLAHLARLAHRTEPKVTDAVVGAGTNPFRFTLPMDFTRSRGANPLDTLLYAPIHNTVNFHVTFGDGSTLLDPAATTTLVVQDAVLTVWLKELSNVPEDLLRRQNLTLWHRWDQIEVSAATTRLQHRLPVGNTYRAFHICATVEGATGGGPVPSDAVIVSIKIRRGTEVLFEWDGDVLQEFNKLAYSMETWNPGWYVIDREVLGLRESGLNTAGQSDLFMEFEVLKPAGTVMINVFPEEIVRSNPVLSGANG